MGTHDNTEHTTYNSHDYLKCSHTSGVLTGTYLSSIFDIGATPALDRHLIYITGQDSAEPDIVIIGAGTTWDDVIPSSTTWDEIQADERTWVEIFNLPEAPKINVNLYYGTASPPTNKIERLEVLSVILPEDNRYFQVEIIITDPSINVYALYECFSLKFATYA